MKRLFSSLPIIGGLADCRTRDHKGALGEFTITLFFATATFWLSAVFLSALKANTDASYWSILFTTYSQGELLIFCVSVLGGIFYTALDEPIHARAFPSKTWHAAIVFGLAVICAGLYAMVRVGADVDLERLIRWSVYLTFAAVCLRYLTLVYHRARQDSDRIMKAQEKSFADNYTGPVA